MQHRFDEAYYRRHYLDPRTRVYGTEEVSKIARLVTAYLAHLELEVDTVLDLGCGIGLWKEPIEKAFPGADYVGVESSVYLCEHYGWERESITTYRPSSPADLVICQGVLQYLNARDARRAIRNLARVTAGALYLEVLTREDWEGNCSQEITDGAVYLRPSAWYRALLSPHFVAIGAGLFLPCDSDAVLFELERVPWTAEPAGQMSRRASRKP